MRVDLTAYVEAAADGGTGAASAEAFGYDGWWAPETTADSFLACGNAAVHTERTRIGTGVAIAFARNPMTVALQANDLQLLSRGRFVLGLGSQVKPHITRRLSMPWSRPAARMREFILAVRAIWDTWQTGAPLDFQGDFYAHTLMTPFFNPGPNPYGNPKIILAGVGPRMSEVAGEVADGIFCHAFLTERYLREQIVPALRRGAAKAGRELSEFEIFLPGMFIGRDTEEEMAKGREFVRRQIGFYGSTPSYRPVLDLHGWGALGEELTAITKRGSWDQLVSVVDDEVLNTFGIIGTPEQVAEEIRRCYGDIATRVGMTVADDANPERWAPVFDLLRSPTDAAALQPSAP